MLVSKRRHLTQSFVAMPADLRRLCETLEELGLDVTCQGECHDFARVFDSWRDLLDFHNSPRQRLLDLETRFKSKDGNTFKNILLDSQSPNRNISLEIGGDEVIAERLNAITADWIATLRPWYGSLARFGSGWAAWVLPAGVGFVLAVILEYMTSGRASLLVGRPLWLVSVTLGMGLAAYALRAPLFPMGVLAFGHGHKRYKDMEIIRTTVAVAFVVSVVASILATVLLGG